MRGYKGKIAPPKYARRAFGGGMRGGCMIYIVFGIGIVVTGLKLFI